MCLSNVIISNNLSRQKKHSAMTLYLISRIFWITYLARVSYPFPVTDVYGAYLYLENFGYLEESSDQETLPASNQESFITAIKDYQKFANINETGELDNETLLMMNMRRCGVKDTIRHSNVMEWYTLQGSKWNKSVLTYRISKYPSNFADTWIVKNEISRAFKVWSDVTNLNFRETLRRSADIDIRFEVGNHGDDYPFDHLGYTLAHAFYPQYGGDAHFNDQVIWTVNETSVLGADLFQVATHEFGHSLGLKHSLVNESVMWANYTEYIPSFQLHRDDIKGIQAIYGPRATPPPSPPRRHTRFPRHPRRTTQLPSTTPITHISYAPDLCNDARIDAVTQTKNGNMYVFKGDFYWNVLDNGIAEGYPRKIFDDWNGLPGNLDASVTCYGKTYFFKEGHYWRFTNTRMDSGYPKLISEGWKGIPDGLDAAFVWSGDDKPYFFKGDQYWCYEVNSQPPVNTTYPQPIRKWSSLLADGIDAVFNWNQATTYFFKGDKYYQYDDENSKILESFIPFPRSTAKWWFHCRT